MPGKVSRGTIVDVTLDPSVGREIMKTRPCVVIQNDIGNKISQLIIVAALTGAENVQQKAPPIYAFVAKGDGGIEKDSYVLCNQIRSIDESRLGKIYGTLSRAAMEERGPLVRKRHQNKHLDFDLVLLDSQT
jgi:mRNA interferase MazF